MDADARWAAKLLVIASLSRLVVTLDVVARPEGPVPLAGSGRLPKFASVRPPGWKSERELRLERGLAEAAVMSAGWRRCSKMEGWRLAANDRSIENLPGRASP